MEKSNQKEPLLATHYMTLQNYGVSPKVPAETEHIAVASATHDPLTYMDTFQGFFGQELFVFSDLK
jgi:hypothetical protein